MDDKNTLRSSFNQAAQTYDAIRPSYPAQLIKDVLALSNMPPGGCALEIGCGTGQATLPFARHGCHILCLDIGQDLLALAAQNLRAYPNVHFANISFEDWPARPDTYDLVYSATAFHWIAPEVGWPKAALILRPGGALAVFANQHPRLRGGFFAEVQPIYARLVPEWGDPRGRPDIRAEVQAQVGTVNATGLFASLEVRTYPWSATYTTAEYLALLSTYSDHLALPEDRRLTLLQAIADLIERRYGGKIERPYLSVLYLAHKQAGA